MIDPQDAKRQQQDQTQPRPGRDDKDEQRVQEEPVQQHLERPRRKAPQEKK